MASVAFHLYADDKYLYSSRLIRKAVGKGAKLVVTGSADTLQALDQLLWTFSVTEFLPHCDAQAILNLRQRSPVLLTQSIHDAPSDSILINLGARVPDGFDRFQRVIEVVADDDDDRQLARQRWKNYVSRGVAPTKYDLDLKAMS